jgi:hypothetical protein
MGFTECMLPVFAVSRTDYVWCAATVSRAKMICFAVIVVAIALLFAAFWHPVAAAAIPIVAIVALWQWFALPVNAGAQWDWMDAQLADMQRVEGLSREEAQKKYMARLATSHLMVGTAHGIGRGLTGRAKI